MHSCNSGIPFLFGLIDFFSLPCFWISEIKSSSFMGFVTFPPVKNILTFGFPAFGTCCSVSCTCLIISAHFLSGRSSLKARHHKHFLYNTKLMPGAESWDFHLPILSVNVCAVTGKLLFPLSTIPLAVDQG